ncbi:CdaR family transcriptional regulator [Metabacillus sp. 84]|uniref:CdaR family transcriptional regulator n=1 Tax=Metabacillus sp. 84 TaxID=3404705 RepID=UPI003CEB0777
MLLPDLADKIVEEVKKVIHEDVIVVSSEGTIIASTDERRKGSFHEGARTASVGKRNVIISTEDEKKLSGVKAGMNLPVFFQGEVACVIGITGSPERILPLGEVVRKMTELLIRENYYSEQLNWEARSREAFIFDWIQLKEWSDPFIRRAQVLHIDLLPHRMAAIAVFQEEALFHKKISAILQTWQNSHQEDIFVRWGHNRIVMLFQAENPAYTKSRIAAYHTYLEEQLNQPVYLGAGKTVKPQRLSESYIQAERALKSSGVKRRVIFDEDLTVEMLLCEVRPETKEEYIERILSPLLPERDLYQTLIMLFEKNHSLKKTAEGLHIHINTLHYRLKKIEELTSLNPSSINDALILYLAVLLMDDHPKPNGIF